MPVIRSTIVCFFLFVLAPAALQAQALPCGFSEWDDVPGYDSGDLQAAAALWLDHGPFPERPDFNDDGLVNILDFVQQSNCMPDLNHGLLAKYYGFDNGSTEDMTFPNFDELPASHLPAAVLAAESLEELDSFTGLMDSNMRFQFGAVFTGYLFVPETADYTLHIFGDRGMRVSLDNQPILAFDTQPREDSTTLELSYGLHPIRVEYYAARTMPRILLDWSSDGEVIGPSAQTISINYLYHEGEEVPPLVISAPEIHFNPPSGSRLDEVVCPLDVHVTGSRSDYTLLIDGQVEPLREGFAHPTLALNHGLNSIPFTIMDGAGQTKTVNYNVYVDREELTNTGVKASLYAMEWAQYPVPDPDDHIPFVVVNHSLLAVSNNNGFTRVAGYYMSKFAVIEMEGAILVPKDAYYQFQINGPGALFVNGEQICGIRSKYRDEDQPLGVIYLTEGYNHVRGYTGSPHQATHFNVYWGLADGDLVPLSEENFRRAPTHGYQGQLPQTVGSGGRHSDSLVAEYLFDPDQPWTDSSGFGSHLLPDPRALVREDGGVTYQSAGTLTSELAGVFLVNRTKQDKQLSLEADFIPDQVFFDDQPREVVSLSTVIEDYLARVFVLNNDLHFRLYDEDGLFEEAVAKDIVEPGVRLHTVATFTPLAIRLMVNGSLAAETAYLPEVRFWPSSAKFNVGQPYIKRISRNLAEHQMIGTFLVAAAYSKNLSEDQVQTNCQANMILRPNPPPLPAPPVVAFPPVGVTPEQLDEAHHILNRLSFGPSPESLAEILDMGVDAWISQQMDPASINDDELEALVNSGYFIPKHDELDLQAKAAFRMIGSKRQLNEVMTQFWENHFNTQHTKVHLLDTEQAENDRFREHALGNFADLLRMSATNYPMVAYLDNRTNVVGAPNENYAREFFELHTMGVNNGYTHDDILEAARVFTGWSVADGDAFFNPGLHDFGAKQAVGLDLPAGGGISDAHLLIDHMVTLRETADFVTWKLCQLFVADNPPIEVHTAASDAFFNSQGDIKTTLSAIFNHDQFRNQTQYRNNKFKTPLEFMTSVCRLSEAFPLTRHTNDYLHAMGMKLFDFADPTGFSEESVSWIDTNGNLTRWNMVNDLTTNRGNGNTFGMNLQHFIQRRGLTTADELLDYFEQITTHGSQPAVTRNTMLSWLTDDNPGGFELTPDTLNNQVRQTFGLYLRLPELNKQ